jgi:hypothetical protein
LGGHQAIELLDLIVIVSLLLLLNSFLNSIKTKQINVASNEDFIHRYTALHVVSMKCNTMETNNNDYRGIQRDTIIILRPFKNPQLLETR